MPVSCHSVFVTWAAGSLFDMGALGCSPELLGTCSHSRIHVKTARPALRDKLLFTIDHWQKQREKALSVDGDSNRGRDTSWYCSLSWATRQALCWAYDVDGSRQPQEAHISVCTRQARAVGLRGAVICSWSLGEEVGLAGVRNQPVSVQKTQAARAEGRHHADTQRGPAVGRRAGAQGLFNSL